MEEKKCPACNAPMESHWNRCSACGFEIQREINTPKLERPCYICHKTIKRETTTCPYCNSNQRPMKDRTLAGLLALILGGLGIHKFYLGQKIGILYLLFCWTFIPGVIAFFEAICLFMTTDQQFQDSLNYKS